MAEQYRDQAMVANCLWPATLLATAAVQNVVAGEDVVRASRRPGIVADAAAILFGRPSTEGSGQCYIDVDVLRAAGISDLSTYAMDGVSDSNLEPELFI